MSTIAIRIMGKDALGNPDDNVRHWLAGDPSLSTTQNPPASEVSRNITRLSDEVSGAGHPYKKFFDRGNQAVQVGFETSRLFEDAASAWRWSNLVSRAVAAENPHPVAGDIVLRFNLPDASWEEERFVGCVLSMPACKATGQTVQLSYQFRASYSEEYGSGITCSLIDADSVRLVDADGVALIADSLT